MQRHRLRATPCDFDVGQNEIVQELGDIQQRNPASCCLLQPLRAWARIDQHRPATVLACRHERGDRFLGFAAGLVCEAPESRMAVRSRDLRGA